MYHIKSDKRSQASAREIVRGLQECLKTMPLRSVNFTDIHRVTGISRSTIYRLFDGIEDILNYQFDHLLQVFGEKYRFSADQALENAITMGMEHHDLLKALVDNGRFDLLYQYTERTLRMPGVSGPSLPEDLSPIEREYILNQLSMSMVASLITWERNGRKETAAQIVQYLTRYVQLIYDQI